MEGTRQVHILGPNLAVLHVNVQFCPTCGSPSYSVWAGWKLSCMSLLPWADNTGKGPCPSRFAAQFNVLDCLLQTESRGVQNFSHPRTDPVVIMVVMDESGEKILLGRNVQRLPLLGII